MPVRRLSSSAARTTFLSAKRPLGPTAPASGPPAVTKLAVSRAVRALFTSLFAYFLSPFGLLALAALDMSMLFFLPFAVDAGVIILTARKPEAAVLYVALATAGSLVGGAVTFWIGRRAGEHGLERFVSKRRLDHVKRRVRDSGAVALALPAMMPPPFPLTPFVLTCGALAVRRTRFFVTLGIVRAVRFGIEAGLAVIYGRRILTWMKSDLFQNIVIGFTVVAVAVTVFGIWSLIRQSHRAERAAPRPA
jgi:membrane protein YqaA with SNARE-associated domain